MGENLRAALTSEYDLADGNDDRVEAAPLSLRWSEMAFTWLIGDMEMDT